MSRTRGHRRRGYPVCSGCTACSWFPKRLQREGKRTEKVQSAEDEYAVEVALAGGVWSWRDDFDEDFDVTHFRDGWWY